jgi:alpha/beta superfamily hydrolase
VTKLSHQRGIHLDYRVVPGAGHFFNEHLDILTDHVEDYLDMALLHRPPAPMRWQDKASPPSNKT